MALYATVTAWYMMIGGVIYFALGGVGLQKKYNMLKYGGNPMQAVGGGRGGADDDDDESDDDYGTDKFDEYATKGNDCMPRKEKASPKKERIW